MKLTRKGPCLGDRRAALLSQTSPIIEVYLGVCRREGVKVQTSPGQGEDGSFLYLSPEATRHQSSWECLAPGHLWIFPLGLDWPSWNTLCL